MNLDSYKQYLLKIGDWSKVRYNRSVCPTAEAFINAMCDFNNKPYNLLPISRASFSKYVNIIFKDQLIGKPHQVAPSKFLLHGFGYRKCAFCKQVKTLDSYYSSSGIGSNWDKLRNDCINCEKEEALLTQNKDIINEKAKRYRDNNKEKIKQYRRDNKEKINSYTAYRRAKIKEQIGVNYRQKDEERYRLIIIYFTKRYKESYVLDHYMPIAKGGLHEPENWQIITKEENLYKNQIDPEKFYKSVKGIWFIKNKIGIRIQ